jgi:hypothetical protein
LKSSVSETSTAGLLNIQFSWSRCS